MTHAKWCAFAALVFSLAALALPLEAAGQDDDRALSASDAEARRHHRLATAYYTNGAFADAAREFESAYALSPRPELLYNLYLAYRDDGDIENAARALRLYLERTEDPPEADTLRARLASLDRQLAARAAPTVAVAREPRQSSPPSAPTASVIASSPSGFVVASVGLAAVVAATITGVLANDRRFALERACGPSRDACPPGFESDRSAGESLAIATDVLGIAGGVAIATGIVMIFAVDGREAPPVSAGCGPDGCGISVRGSF